MVTVENEQNDGIIVLKLDKTFLYSFIYCSSNSYDQVAQLVRLV